jgi:pimeloyl-ACP methyl ester carboxylesterase
MAPTKITTAQKLAINYYRAKLNFINSISTRWAANEAVDLFTKPYPVRKKQDPPIWTKSIELVLETEFGKVIGYNWKAHKPTGKKFLIVHGFAGNSRSFERYIKPALAKGYDVYAFDAPAHGKSEGRRLNAATYVNMLQTIIDRYGSFDAYMAHSLGGLSLMLALHQVSYHNNPKIVLIAPATESTTAAEIFYKFLQLPARLRAAFEKKIKETVGVPLQWYSISRILHDIKGDILWLHDEDDHTTPIKDVYPLMNQQPLHVHFHFTKGLGHSRIYKDMKVKQLIVDFL